MEIRCSSSANSLEFHGGKEGFRIKTPCTPWLILAYWTFPGEIKGMRRKKFKEKVQMKKAIPFLLVLIIGIAFLVGCKGGGKDSLPTGKYPMVSMLIGDEDLLDLYRSMGMSTDDFYLEILSGGKFKLAMTDDVTEGSYKVSGNTIKLEDMEGKIDGKKIIFEEKESGVKMIFEKK